MLHQEEVEVFGGVPCVDPDESIDVHESNIPSPTFSGFLTELDRSGSLGILPYEFLIDPSKIGGASVRLIASKTQRYIDDMTQLKPDYITNKEGTLKTAGYPPSQNDDERAALQAETQSYFELFKSHVLAHRNIEKEDMRGQAFVGAEAFRRGLVDDICDKNSAYDKLRILTRG